MATFGLSGLLCVVALGSVSPGAPILGAVRLASQHGRIEKIGAQASVHVRARLINTLPVPLSAVWIGVVVGSSAEALRDKDLGLAYDVVTDDASRSADVTRVDIALPASSERSIELKQVIPTMRTPQVFAVHLLGYELAEISTPLLFALLCTGVAADEVAAAHAFALTAETQPRVLVRQRWLPQRSVLMTDLEAELNRDIPNRPSQSETFRRVYAVRAVGVLGGDQAAVALRRLLAHPNLGHFDEPLQVLRIARLTGSRWKTPLAFTLPASVRNMSQVVDLALKDVETLETDAQ